jgi:hypothetical protein
MDAREVRPCRRCCAADVGRRRPHRRRSRRPEPHVPLSRAFLARYAYPIVYGVWEFLGPPVRSRPCFNFGRAAARLAVASCAASSRPAVTTRPIPALACQAPASANVPPTRSAGTSTTRRRSQGCFGTPTVWTNERTPGRAGGSAGGRYWDRTSDLFRVREARYRCANRPGTACCEVETGFEPACTALQAAASPLGHSTVVEQSARPTVPLERMTRFELATLTLAR